MSYAASIGYNQPAASNVLHGMFREQEWLPGTIATSASARRELETQLIMDRLLRVGVSTARQRQGPMRQGHWLDQYKATPEPERCE